MLRYFLLSFIVFYISGCLSLRIHSPSHAPFQGTVLVFHGDTAFTPDERATIERAATTWDYYSNGIISFDIRWDLDWNSIASIQAHQADNTILRITSNSSATTIGDLAAHGRALGFTVQDATHPERPIQVFLVIDRLIDYRLEPVATHELGHALQLSHQPQYPASLMSPHLTGVECPSKKEMTEFCSHWHCNVETDVRWCSY